jgi:cellulose biosynthesis protein BcsQ
MAVIAIYSVKGGVGKTTLAANLAWASATLSRRSTLLWDLDPQGGSGFLLGLGDPGGENAARIFEGKAAPEKAIRKTDYKRLDVLPADRSLRTLGRTLAAIGKKKRIAKIAAGLASDYDRVLLDCPPVINEVSAQVLRAADIVLVPLPPSPLSARALPMIREHFTQERRKHPPILPVLSMLDARRALHRQLRAGMPHWPVIPMASVVEQGAVRREPVGAFAPASPAAQGFARVWRAVEAKLAQGEG